MYEVLLYGRGGQGVVMASEVIVWAAAKENKFGVSFPFFGGERRGAPTKAFVRISEEEIKERSQIKNPNILILFSLPKEIQKAKYIVANCSEEEARKIKLKRSKAKIISLEATKVSKELGLKFAGWYVVNSPMLGAFAKLGILKLKSLEEAVRDYWEDEKNVLAVRKGYENAKIL
ncbi:MAG: 2-oxoacid:acceptor oxidoreductase family protein [Candidatus Micrarchaeia archaeon]|jgi:pyruvate ferredoxin oxidoreductase gamma subunit